MKKLILIATTLIAGTAIASGDMHHKKHKDHKMKKQHMMHNDSNLKPMYVTAEMDKHHKQMMRHHLETLQKITQNLASSNFTKAHEVASILGYSKEEAAGCGMMGAATPGFTDLGINMHKTADKMIAAIKKKDLMASLQGLSDTMGTCTSCHATYYHKVVSQAEFAKQSLPKSK